MAAIQVTADIKALQEIREAMKFLPRKAAQTYYKKAMEAAIKPARERLRQLTPVSATGNLRRAVTSKVLVYPSLVVLGLVGYRRSGTGKSSPGKRGGKVRIGNDRGYHQNFLEYGAGYKTPRQIKTFSNKKFTRGPYVRKDGSVVRSHIVSGQGGYIASSWNSTGVFQTKRKRGGDISTTPRYPKAFFRKFKKGESPVLPRMDPGGRSGLPPIETTYTQTRGQIAQILEQRLRVALEESWNAISLLNTGSVSGG